MGRLYSSPYFLNHLYAYLYHSLALCLVALQYLILAPTFDLVCRYSLSAQQITVDASAPESRRPSLDSAPNGVPIVNIARPNSAGVSHNLFQDFNVEQRGVVINNSQSIDQSQLAGALMGNPNFRDQRTASLIINEVTGGRPSHLRGYTEILGKQAEYVLANPYGITCNGCGFINTPLSTLTTGRPQYSGDRLSGFGVDQGEVRFTGSGLNADNSQIFAVISRSVVVEAEVRAKDLRFYIGRNNFNYMARRIRSQRAASIGGSRPAWALDAKAVGSMYADRIYLESTEAGLGVRMFSNMAANADDLVITANGGLGLKNQMSARRNITLHSQQHINVEEHIYAGNRIELNASQVSVLASGYLFAGHQLQINASNMDNSGQVASGVGSNGTLFSSQGTLQLKLTNNLQNLGILAAGNNLFSQAGGVITNGSGNGDGLVYSLGSIELYFNELLNDEGAEILAQGNITTARDISLGRAARMVNQSGRIEAQAGSITIYSDVVENSKKGFSVSRHRDNNVLLVIHRDGNNPHNTRYGIPWFECHEGNCFGNPQSGTARVLREWTRAHGNVNAPAGQILSGVDIQIFANTLSNTYSQLHAGDDIYINVNQIHNRGGEVYDLFETRRWEIEWCCGHGRTHGGDVKYRPNWSPGSRVRHDRRQLQAPISASIEARDSIDIIGTSIQNSGSGIAREDTTSNLNFSTDSPDIGLPSGSKGLFVINNAPGHRYLIETNPLFTRVDQYIGSEYFFERSGFRFNEMEQIQRLGDPYYETRLVEQQIREQTGRRFTEEDIVDSVEQMRRLFDNAALAGEDLQLTVGISLSVGQVQRLGKDIVWLEERTVQGKKVLVPQLYLTKLSRDDVSFSRATIHGKNIDLNAAVVVNAGGSVLAKDELSIITNHSDIRNTIGVIKGGRVILDSRANILNEGGDILGEDVVLSAVDNVINKSLKSRVKADDHNYTDYITGSANIQAENSLMITSSQGSILNTGAEIRAGGYASLNAAANVILDSLGLESESDIRFGGGKHGYEKSHQLKNVGSSLNVGGNLTLTTNGNLGLLGSKVHVDSQANIHATAGIIISHVLDEDYYDKQTTVSKKSGMFGKKTTVTREGYYKESVQSSGISAGGNLSLNSKQAVMIVGSDLKSDANLTIGNELVVEEGQSGNLVIADGNQSMTSLFILSAQARNENWYSQETTSKIFGIDTQKFAAKISSGLAYASIVSPALAVRIENELGNTLDGPEKYQTQTQDIRQYQAELIAGSEMSLDASGDILFQGASMQAGDDMSISALGNVQVSAAVESTRTTEHHSQMTFDGLSVGFDLSGDNFKYTASTSFTTSEAQKIIERENLVSSTLFSKNQLSIHSNANIEIIAAGSSNEDTTQDQQPQGIIAVGNMIMHADGNLHILAKNEIEKIINENKATTVEQSISVGNVIVEAARNVHRLSQEGRDKSETPGNATSLSSSEQDPDAKSKNNYRDLVQLAEGLNVLGKVSNLAGSIKRAAASKGTFGFYAELGFRTQTQSQSTETTSERAVASLIASLGADVNLSADKELKISASDVMSYQGDINLYSNENIIIQAATQNINREHSNSSQNTAVSVDTTTSASTSYAKSEEKLSSNRIIWRHSSLSAANGTLDISSSSNVLVKGALATAKHIKADIGGQLKLETVQDTTTTNSSGYSINIGSDTNGSFSLGTTSSTGEGHYHWASKQTALIGTKSVNAKADTISILGAKISNETYIDDKNEVSDGGNLSITAREISYSNLAQEDYSFYQKVGGSISGQKDKHTGTGFEFATSSHDKQGILKATIGKGTVTSKSDISQINRDIANANEITKNEMHETVHMSIDIEMEMFSDPKKYAERFINVSGDVANLAEQVIDASKKLKNKLDNLNDYGYFSTKEKIVGLLGNSTASELSVGEKKFIEDLYDRQKIASELIKAGDMKLELMAALKKDLGLWQEAIQFIPAAGGMARDGLTTEILTGKGSYAYQPSQYYWIGGNKTVAVMQLHGPKAKEYFQVIRQYDPNDGSQKTVGKPKKIDEDTFKNFKELNNNKKIYKGTWCNSYASQVGVQAYGAPSLQSYNNRNGWNANQIFDNLKNGHYNTAGQGSFQGVSNHKKAAALASDGHFVVASISKPISHGHIAVVRGSYAGEPSLNNLRISQAGAKVGNMTYEEGFNSKRSPKFYVWKAKGR